MNEKIDLTGQRFGKLTVVGIDGNNHKSGTYWMCICDCQNNERVPKQRSIRQDKLLEGKTLSCGCLKKEQKTRGKRKTNIFDLTSSDEYAIGYTFKGERFIFDKEDFDLIKTVSECWHFNDGGYLEARDKRGNNLYKNNKKKMVYMKDIVMNKKEGEIVKFVTKDKSNMCKNNLLKIKKNYKEVIMKMFKDKDEEWFINGCKELKNENNNIDVLNWYRNLYYKEDKNTERGKIAWAINGLFMELKEKGFDLYSLSDEDIR